MFTKPSFNNSQINGLRLSLWLVALLCVPLWTFAASAPARSNASPAAPRINSQQRLMSADNYGKNLLLNSGFESDAGMVYKWDNNADDHFNAHYDNLTGINRYFHTGYGDGATLSQTVDLTEKFTEDELAAQPKVYFKVDYCVTKYLHTLSVQVQYLSSDNTVLKTTKCLDMQESSSTTVKPMPWQTCQVTETLPEGARKVKVILGGSGGATHTDGSNGPGFDNASIALGDPSTTAATHKLTVTSNKDGETAYGTGTYWEGSTVYFGTVHGLTDHTCDYAFSGYEGESDPDLTTTARVITIGTADATYNAIFGKANTATLSKTVVYVNVDGETTFTQPTLTLPADYKGTVTYKSSDETIATVDNSGNVTYVGNGTEGTVTITVSVLSDGNYGAAILPYTVTYKKYGNNYGVELVADGDINQYPNDLTVWKNTSDIKPLVSKATNISSINRYFDFYYGTENSVYQDIDLGTYFMPDELDAYPKAYLSFDHSITRSMKKQLVKVQYMNESGTVIGENTYLDKTSDGAISPEPWQTFQSVETIPVGTRSVRITLTGSAGTVLYGPSFDNISFVIRKASTKVNSYKVTVSSNKTGETAYGSGTYWEGSKVHISNIHGMEDHSCSYEFAGYQGENNPDTNTTVRQITVGSADAEYTALFGKANSSAFSATTTSAIADKSVKFTAPTLTLPSDYTGTVTYSSSDETVATVSQTGAVTYVGDGTEASVTITATLSGDKNYMPTTRSYIINYRTYGSNFGKELVTGGDFESAANDGAWPAATGAYGAFHTDATKGINRYFHTGKSGQSRVQEINLESLFSADELDASPKAYFKFDYFCTGGLTTEEVILHFQDASGTEISQTKALSRSLADGTLQPEPWQTSQTTVTVPKGTRSVRISLKGSGTGSDASNTVDGPGFDNVSLELRDADTEVSTHTVTVSSERTDETMYGSGTYWEGSTVYIGTGHDVSGHTCGNAFTGYEGESDADITTTQRLITIGSEDATYTALFEKGINATLSGTAFKAPAADNDFFKEPTLTLPDDYKGKVTYKSSDTSIATVDSEGKVTYVGRGTKADVTITVTLPADGEYKHGKTLSYTISYYPYSTSYNTELVKNGNFESYQNAWTMDNWSYNDGFWPHAVDEVTPNIGTYLNSNYQKTSNNYQDIDLTKLFTAEELDFSPVVYFSFDHKCVNYQMIEDVSLIYYDANGDEISTSKMYYASNDNTYVYQSPWTTVQKEDIVPVGARKIRVNLNGQSGGDYFSGPGIDNVSLKLQRTDTKIAKHKVTVLTSTTSEVGYGEGTFWEGSTVMIGTSHNNVASHSCSNIFAGYSNETEPNLESSQRSITVGTEDVVYTANFGVENTAAFDKTTFLYYTDNAGNITTPTLNRPTDYAGNITYKSSDTSIATVSDRGKVTYVGDGKTGMVTITATLLYDNKYATKYVSYTIQFVDLDAAYGTNLVTNPTFDEKGVYTAWTSTSTNGDWLNQDVTVDRIQNYIVTSYIGGGVKQDIDLTKTFQATELDASPVAMFSIDHSILRTVSADKVTAEFLNASGTSLGTLTLINKSYDNAITQPEPWTTLQGSQTLPVGTRTVRIEMYGKCQAPDLPNDYGRWGPCFDNVNFYLMPQNYEIKKHKVVLSINKRDNSETLYGAGEYWEGSTVMIGTSHKLYKHSCSNSFFGYENEVDPDTVQTQRTIVIGTEDATYKALFGKWNPAAFSQEKFIVATNASEKFVEPTLSKAADYTGTVYYESSDKTLATVDPVAGKVTYVGNGKTGDVTITAKLAYDENYSYATQSYLIHYQDGGLYFGKELLDNGNFGSGLNSWSKELGTDYQVLTEEDVPGINRYLQTGNGLTTLVQYVDLDSLFTEPELDDKAVMYLAFDRKVTKNLGDQYVSLTYYDASGNQIEENKLGRKQSSVSNTPEPWTTCQVTDTIPVGARSVKVKMYGYGIVSGEESDNGTGPAFANVSLMMRDKDTVVPTHKITVETDVTDGSEAAAGSGDYWEGTKVMIGTEHNLYNHSCGNAFTGYKGEADPITTTTQRQVTVGTEDATYTATFRVAPLATFSQSSYYVLTAEAADFVEPTLNKPADHNGAVTYTSSNTSVATVNASTGKVTYKGNDVEGTTTITATLASDGTYGISTASYTITYAKGIVSIANEKEWDDFKAQYSGKFVIAKLTGDIALTQDDRAMESFDGVFDGQGHTITVTYDNVNDGYNNGQRAPFLSASGVIRNLNVAGTITYLGTDNSCAPLVCTVSGGSSVTVKTLTIENCQSTVQFKPQNAMHKMTGGNAGGFIYAVGSYSDVTFKDCSFTGTFDDTKVAHAGGFVGMKYSAASESKLTFENCFSDWSNNTLTELGDSVGYFLGETTDTKADKLLTVNNCYARGVNDLQFGNNKGATVVTDDAVKNGEVAYKLNNGRKSDDAAWMQTIGTDDIPMIKTLSEGSLEVFYAEESTLSIDDNYATFFYPTVVTLPAGVTAYEVKDITDGYINLVETDLGAYKPVVLHSESTIGDIELPELYYNKVEQTGMLRGVYETTAPESDWYLFEKVDGKAMFTKGNALSAAAWTGYLVDAAQTESSLRTLLPGETGINTIKADAIDGNVYNLAGQKVETLRPGQIYIVKGKKFRATTTKK